MKNPDDQAKLTKILDVAHELKPSGLSELFELSHFNFTIDLACLASKRDYLKLEKWLEDKEQAHGVRECGRIIDLPPLLFRSHS